MELKALMQVDGFADSDWVESISRRSMATIGLMARFNQSVVQWRFKMQKSVQLFKLTAEAELYSASEMAIEIFYLRNLLQIMGFPQALDTPVYGDNSTACIKWGDHVICRLTGSASESSKHFDLETIHAWPEAGFWQRDSGAVTLA